MTAQHATNLLAWIRQQAADVADIKRRRAAAEDQQCKLDLLRGVEVRDSSWDEWEDTVAAFACMKL